MKKGMSRIIFAFLSILLATLACEFNASTATIKDATLARDSAGTDPTTVFGPNDTFYCIVQLANAPDDTVVKAIWYGVDGQSTTPNFVLDEAEATGGTGGVFNLTTDVPWPTGPYKVEIYLNGTLDRTLEFQVQ